ncbi:MAG: methylenetetrahydrofolate reductase [Chloroflexota bacterium]
MAHARFEVVPVRGVDEQARLLPAGATVTVTCSPTRGVENTLQVAGRLAGQGLRVVPHIAARLVTDTAHLQDLLQQVADLAIRDVFVIAGDANEPIGQFSNSLDLLRAMNDTGHNLDEVGVAAYPEGHPLIDHGALSQALIEKQSLATYMVTQICFDPQKILLWLDVARDQGVTLPVYIGIPGLVDARRLLQISVRIGVGDSMRFLAKHTNVVAGLLGRGGYHPNRLVEGIAPYLDGERHNIRGLHINTFNQVQGTVQWQQELMLATAQS